MGDRSPDTMGQVVEAANLGGRILIAPGGLQLIRREEFVAHDDAELIVDKLRGLNNGATLEGNNGKARLGQLLDHDAAARTRADDADVKLIPLKHRAPLWCNGFHCVKSSCLQC